MSKKRPQDETSTLYLGATERRRLDIILQEAGIATGKTERAKLARLLFKHGLKYPNITNQEIKILFGT